MSRQPNLFILGAPKCGTTSMARWLEGHPDVYVPSEKEPHHYNTDEKQIYYSDREEYLRLFESGESARYRLDASVWYLHSHVAVSRILGDCPDARFLVCLRNPVDMAFSLHSQYLNKTGREHIKSFEKAWSLSEERLRGRFVSSLVSDPKYLAYKYSCRIGSQSKRLLATIPEDRVKFVVLDDLIADPERTLLEVLYFLNLPPDIPSRLPYENAALRLRFPALRRVHIFISRLTNRSGIGIVPPGARHIFRKLNTVEIKSEMNLETRRLVTRYFREEIQMVWEVAGNRYEQWVQCIEPDAELARGNNEKASE